MKKYYTILSFFCLSNFVFAQLKINSNTSTSNMSVTTSAFLDASSSVNWNNNASSGKGILFPRAN